MIIFLKDCRGDEWKGRVGWGGGAGNKREDDCGVREKKRDEKSIPENYTLPVTVRESLGEHMKGLFSCGQDENRDPKPSLEQEKCVKKNSGGNVFLFFFESKNLSKFRTENMCKKKHSGGIVFFFFPDAKISV